MQAWGSGEMRKEQKREENMFFQLSVITPQKSRSMI